MPAALKASGSAAIGTVQTTVYTTPGATSTLVHSLILSNILASTINVTVAWTDSSAAATYNLVKNAPISPGGSLVIAGDNNKIVLEANDAIKVTSDTAASVDASISVLEES